MIKLRAWIIPYKKMANVELLDTRFKDIVVTFDDDKDEKEFEFIHGEYVLMQYTGVKDDYGTDIYEGDIVDVISGISTVTFDDGCYRTNLKGNNYRLSGWRNVKVIGNIYENPELWRTTDDRSH